MVVCPLVAEPGERRKPVGLAPKNMGAAAVRFKIDRALNLKIEFQYRGATALARRSASRRA
jgi:hypothetical protein